MPREPDVLTPIIDYPTSDGTPVAETETHFNLITDTRDRLRAWFAARPDVYVGANLFVYFEPGNLAEVLAPDCFVAFGVPSRVRDVFKTWEEGAHPAVVFEFTSKKTKREDLTNKFAVYRDVWRVREYFVFDPKGEYLKPPLRGYRRSGRELAPIKPTNGALVSKSLGLALTADGPRLTLRDGVTGEALLTAAQRAETERAARQVAEAEVTRLQAELAALRKKKPTA